ncbi:glycosyltransferase family 1 protein [Anaeromyxobacter sp. SG17]|uniref:glycosyltransferase family 4 protein n=1 Tax=Anaeromyxobacter sp. SG17 TaxID=2925405 RepID=UPI001F55C2D9|nr:glycosyltransferase family 1 protein [Anaeromyxobacter sp. SG17]
MAARGILRVCIDARLGDGVPGGVQQTLIGLANGLSRLEGGEEEYLFLAYEDCDWLEPYLKGSCELLACERPRPRGGWRAAVRSLVPKPLLDRVTQEIAARRPIPLPPANAVVQAARPDVMHFAQQHGFRTTIPSIYVPHDLQHRHLPGNFSRFDLRWREDTYRALCGQASRVVALTRWGKRDLVEQFGLEPSKIVVIGWAPVLDAYPAPTEAALRRVRDTFHLPDAFALYPAQTFRHKNHLGLVEALALARDRGVEVPVVCTGRTTELRTRIERRARELRVGHLLRFVGFVSPAELHALYALARILVFPSEFEGFGMPVQEAFRAKVAVACSSAASLGDLAGDAALQFAPDDRDAMAEAIRRLWTDAPLRGELARRGAQRVERSSWLEVARSYRALYRAVAARPLQDEDAALLRAAD